MKEIDAVIRRDIESDVSIKVKALSVEVGKKGFLSRRRTVTIHGSVETQHDRDKIERIAHHHAGDAFTVENEITLREPAEA